VPYYHSGCKGKIRWFPFLPIPPKCLKCNKKWPWWVQYGPKRNDMIYEVPIQVPKKGTTSYAKWADNAPPGAAFIASRLPNWPRWLRITSLLGSVIVLSGLFYGLYLVGWWAVLTGIVVINIVLILIVGKKRRGSHL